MPDSGQNFLDLLFGGVQQGLGQFRKQQAQETDLFLTLQQMLNQQAAQRQAQFRQGQQVELQKTAMRSAETQRGFERAMAMAQGRRQSELHAENLTDIRAQRQRVKDRDAMFGELSKEYPDLAPLFGAMKAGVSGPGLSALSDKLSSPTGSKYLDQAFGRGLVALFSQSDPMTGVPIFPTKDQVTEYMSMWSGMKPGGEAGEFETTAGDPVVEKMVAIAQGTTKHKLDINEAMALITRDELKWESDASFDPFDPPPTPEARGLARLKELHEDGVISTADYLRMQKLLGFKQKTTMPKPRLTR